LAIVAAARSAQTGRRERTDGCAPARSCMEIRKAIFGFLSQPARVGYSFATDRVLRKYSICGFGRICLFLPGVGGASLAVRALARSQQAVDVSFLFVAGDLLESSWRRPFMEE
jgi:hypothetical protein